MHKPSILHALGAAVLLALAACATPQPDGEQVEAPPGAQDARRSGLDLAGMDPGVAPGEDFFQYANGGWLRSTAIPADRPAWSAFAELRARAEADTRAILDDVAADAGATGARRQLGDFHAAWMDEAAIEARGLAPLQPELDTIAALADRQALAAHLGSGLRADVDLLNMTDFYTDRLFGLWVAPDLLTGEGYAPYLVQGGLGMPDRDFYLDPGERMAGLRDQYRAHAARLLELAGFDDAAARAARVLDLETAIARVHATQEQTNDVALGANAWSRAELAERAPGLDWATFLDAAALGRQERFIVWQPDAVRGISALVASAPLATWQDWLRVRALDRAAPLLPRPLADAHFAFHGQALRGVPEQPARWKRAVEAANAALGDTIGQLYVERHFHPQTAARARAMIDEVIAAFGRRLEALDWMSAQTRERALAKLGTLTVDVGHPARWRDYSGLEIRRDDALGNSRRAELFEYRRNLARLGQPIDRGEWFMDPQTVNALNLPLENRLQFPAAILQPPFFDPDGDDAANYGALGAIIGHEITHSFDDSGALFDEHGRLANWWTPEDLARFETAGARLAAQFDAYRPFPDAGVNGRLTLGENIADVAGLATAFDAWRHVHAADAGSVIDGFDGAQRFFLGWAQAWRIHWREPALRTSLLTGVHAPGQYRALTVRNQDAWYPAFDVQPGQALYLEPAARVKVW